MINRQRSRIPFAACAYTATRTASLALYVFIALIVMSIWRNPLRIRHEVWQVLQGPFALFVLIAAMVHIFVLGRYTTTLVMQAVSLLYAVLVTGLLLYYKIMQPVLRWNKQWKVLENRLEPVEHGLWCWSQTDTKQPLT